MASYCLINKCPWVDHVDNLLNHMKLYHRDHIIELFSSNVIYLWLNDFLIRSSNQQPLLVLTEFGLYWFMRRKKSSVEMLLGLYHIGDTANINYTIQFGQKHDGWVMYYGGYKTQSDTVLNECRNDIYPISYFQQDVDTMQQNNCKTVKLILHAEDEWIDTDEFPPDHPDTYGVDWNDELSIELNSKICIDNLFCVICYVTLQNSKEVITCVNQHTICQLCMEDYKKNDKKVKCPCCNEIMECDDDLENHAVQTPTPKDLTFLDSDYETIITLENDVGPENDMDENDYF